MAIEPIGLEELMYTFWLVEVIVTEAGEAKNPIVVLGVYPPPDTKFHPARVPPFACQLALPLASLVSTRLAAAPVVICIPVVLTVPFTSSLEVGALTPIPTLPEVLLYTSLPV